MKLEIENITEEDIKALEKILEGPCSGYDEHVALFNVEYSLNPKALSRACVELNKVVTMELVFEGDEVKLADGSKFTVNEDGEWIKQVLH